MPDTTAHLQRSCEVHFSMRLKLIWCQKEGGGIHNVRQGVILLCLIGRCVFRTEKRCVFCVNMSPPDDEVISKPQKPSNCSWWQQNVLMGKAEQTEETGQISADSWPIISENVSLENITRPQCEAVLKTFSVAKCLEVARWHRSVEPEIESRLNCLFSIHWYLEDHWYVHQNMLEAAVSWIVSSWTSGTQSVWFCCASWEFPTSDLCDITAPSNIQGN